MKKLTEFVDANAPLIDELKALGINPDCVVALKFDFNKEIQSRTNDNSTFWTIERQLQYSNIYCFRISEAKRSYLTHAVLFVSGQSNAVVVPITGHRTVTRAVYEEERNRRGAPINEETWKRDEGDCQLFIDSDKAIRLNSVMIVVGRSGQASRFYLNASALDRAIDADTLNKLENERILADAEAARKLLAKVAFENGIRPNRSKKDTMIYKLMSTLKDFPSINAAAVALDILKMYL